MFALMITNARQHEWRRQESPNQGIARPSRFDPDETVRRRTEV
jgi:hypothetical protein